MRRTRFTRAITVGSNGLEGTRMRSGILMLLPIEWQKVEGIGPSPLEEGIRDREQEPETTITTSWRHDLNTFLKQLKGLNGVDMRT